MIFELETYLDIGQPVWIVNEYIEMRPACDPCKNAKIHRKVISGHITAIEIRVTLISGGIDIKDSLEEYRINEVGSQGDNYYSRCRKDIFLTADEANKESVIIKAGW